MMGFHCGNVCFQFFEELATETNPGKPSEVKDPQGKQVIYILMALKRLEAHILSPLWASEEYELKTYVKKYKQQNAVSCNE